MAITDEERRKMAAKHATEHCFHRMQNPPESLILGDMTKLRRQLEWGIKESQGTWVMLNIPKVQAEAYLDLLKKLEGQTDPLPVMERVAVYLKKLRDYDDDPEYVIDVLEALSDTIAAIKRERGLIKEADDGIV